MSKYISCVFETPENEYAEWFGYYNYDPLNIDKNRIIMNRASFDGVAIEPGMKIELGYYNIQNGSWHSIGNSDSFNWQQGAMLQWLPDDSNKVIFNYSKGNTFKSCILDVTTHTKKELPYPIYGIHPSGKYALCLNYERLYWCRAYHYQSVINPDYNVKIDKNDGIFKLDLTTDNLELIISIRDIVKIDSDPDFKEASHWIEHVMINPEGTRVAFLHRFSYGDVMSYGTRLFIANIDGSNLQIIKGWRDFGWSHFGWCGNNAFTIYTYIAPSILRNISKPGLTTAPSLKTKTLAFGKRIAKAFIPRPILNRLFGKASFYQFYRIVDNKPVLDSEFKKGWFRIDGHPSFTQDEQYMITDTYPDGKGLQRLLIMNIKNQKSLILGTFKAPLQGNPASCDLHPKLSRDNNYVSIDTAHSGRHQMMLFKLNWDIIKDKIG